MKKERKNGERWLDRDLRKKERKKERRKRERGDWREIYSDRWQE